jgi:hypothetical protein
MRVGSDHVRPHADALRISFVGPIFCGSQQRGSDPIAAFVLVHNEGQNLGTFTVGQFVARFNCDKSDDPRMPFTNENTTTFRNTRKNSLDRYRIVRISELGEQRNERRCVGRCCRPYANAIGQGRLP